MKVLKYLKKKGLNAPRAELVKAMEEAVAAGLPLEAAFEAAVLA